jgi:phosphate/sulfate permease
VELANIIIILGFIFAAYAIVGNDAIQTLGTFLSSNAHRPWWVLWLYASVILSAVTFYGWYAYDGDVSYGRLEKIHEKIEIQRFSEKLAKQTVPVDELPADFQQTYLEIVESSADPANPGEYTDLAKGILTYLSANAAEGDVPGYERYDIELKIEWFHLLPPLVLLLLTRFGFPVSTTFLVLISFAPAALGPMLVKSILGYLVAFVTAIALYYFISRTVETRFAATKDEPIKPYWVVLQWFSTGFLWANWLIQDLANIYVYLPKSLSTTEFFVSLGLMILLHAYIFANKGGKIQRIVLSKFNTTDIRSATIIDFVLGMIYLVFKHISQMPMSTTWVFVGLLAGRQMAFALFTNHAPRDGTFKMILSDGSKILLGLVVSIIMAYVLNYFRQLG